MNRFPLSTHPHNSIKIYYYTNGLPKNISVFVKRAIKETPALNFTEEITVEKDLQAIGAIIDDKKYKDSKEAGKNSQPSSNKAREKYFVDIEN